MIPIVFGVAAFALGVGAFSKNGLPLAPGLNITGITAKLLGVFCFLLGCALIGYGIVEILVLGGHMR